MASPVEIYQTEMHRNLGFYATWLPGDLIEIGDVGELQNGRFRRKTSLTDLGISYTTRDAGTPQNVQYTSAKGTKVGTGTSASAAGIAGVEINIEFSADGAFVFHAMGLQASRLQELPAVGASVLAAYEEGRWRKEWLLVEAVHVADCATIIISQDNSASLVLTGSASGPIRYCRWRIQRPDWMSHQAAENWFTSWEDERSGRFSPVCELSTRSLRSHHLPRRGAKRGDRLHSSVRNSRSSLIANLSN